MKIKFLSSFGIAFFFYLRSCRVQEVGWQIFNFVKLKPDNTITFSASILILLFSIILRCHHSGSMIRTSGTLKLI